MEVQARKFYSQRNMYLCGFTLFLSLILNRTYVLILDILRLEEKVRQHETSAKALGKGSDDLGSIGQIAGLKKQLAEKERDLETMKKQSEGLSKEYNTLGDRYTTLEGGSADVTPRKDR